MKGEEGEGRGHTIGADMRSKRLCSRGLKKRESGSDKEREREVGGKQQRRSDGHGTREKPFLFI